MSHANNHSLDQNYYTEASLESVTAKANVDRVINAATDTHSVKKAIGNKDQSASVLIPQGQLQNLSNPITAGFITINSLREGWNDVVPYASDPLDDNGGPGAIDWITITLAHDNEYLYVRYQVADGPSFDLDNAFKYSVFLDVDRDRSTGFVGFSSQLSIGADVLFQGRREGGAVYASVFEFTGVTQIEWGWRLISDNGVDGQTSSGTSHDIEWRTKITDLDIFQAFVNSFDWVATQESGIVDYYPDGGSGGATGDYSTYTFSFPNPERGFHHFTETHSDDYTPLDVDTLRGYREKEGITLIQRMFYLEDFVVSDISEGYLSAMQDDFDTIRQAGLKVVVRFAYTNDPSRCDASKEWILKHIEQMRPILRVNSDIIAASQAGFIGAWGEWWYSCHFKADDNWDDRREVLFAILDALPITRMVQLRAPRYKMLIFDTTCPVCKCQAHTGSHFARTAPFNDCFLSSITDYGTYVYTPTEYIYLRDDTKYLVMGGETCIPDFPGDPDPARLKCETALQEMASFHWSFLNIDWHTPTLRSWWDSGCFNEIRQRLGYRFKLLSAEYSNSVRPGDDFTVRLQLENAGFAAPYNPRDVELILRHATSGSIQRFKLSDKPRFWLPGETYTISHSIRIPQGFPAGSYELLLNLPDPEPTLHNRPEYAVRLANIGMWEPETGYNKLNHELVIEQHNNYLPIIFKRR